MKQEFLKHKLAYIVLVLFLFLIAFLFLAAWPDIVYQRYLILMASTFYFFWGMINHFKEKKITKKIVLEYVGISVLAGSLMFLITL